MAWVKVHEMVIGPKLRSLAREVGCSQNEALGILLRMWLWGIRNADACGKIIGGDERDIIDAVGVGLGDGQSAEKVVDALRKTGWVDVDECGAYLHDWGEWQSQWYKDVENRRRDAERKRTARARKRGAQADGGGPKGPEPREAVKKTRRKEYPEGFERFWAAYPRQVGKGEAYRKYSARVKDGWSEAELTEAAARYAENVRRNKTDEQFIKHPKTFLSDATPFTDFLGKVGKGSDGPDVADANSDDPYAEWRT